MIETGGKQYVVSEGDTITVEKLNEAQEGKTVTFDKVLLTSDGTKTDIGTPYIAGAKITAECVETGRGKKIIVQKFKNKTRYRVKKGHRQAFTKVKIAGGKEEKKKSPAKKTETKPTQKKTTIKK